VEGTVGNLRFYLTILAPAAMQLLRDWNWWVPAFLEKRLPRIDLAE
jgi:uncharacterized membrane protein YdfJ with MMPL/SSD domain